MTSYPQETQQIMRKFYNTLSEKDKRRYAATEAIKFGHGGVSIIAEILGCARSAEVPRGLFGPYGHLLANGADLEAIAQSP